MKLRLLSAAFVAVLLGGVAANAQFHPHSTTVETTEVAVASLQKAAEAETADATGMAIETDRQKQAAEAQRAELARQAKAAADATAAKAEKARLAQAAVQAKKASRGGSHLRVAPAPAPAVQASGDLIDRLAGCESGGNPRSISAPYNRKGDRFYGAFQFMLSTWHSFRPGNPIDYNYSEQKAVIQDHFPVSSWRTQFPKCARRLGVA